MIEAMSCGTPFIAFRCGAVPEVVEHGVSGFVVLSFDEAAESVRQLGTLSRSMVRFCFERRFTVEQMTRRYVNIYQDLANHRLAPQYASPCF
jgi:glycosyltransferase involved in cell wall biosynthesis